MSIRSDCGALLALLISDIVPCSASAQEIAATLTPPAAQRQPTLDELLGLESEPRADVRLVRPTDLSGPGAADSSDPAALMEAALSYMETSATYLTGSRDPGLTTQRSQEEVLRQLDALIAMAQQNQNRNQSQQQQQQQQAQQSGDQQQRQQQQGSPQPVDSDNMGADGRPALQQAELSGEIRESGSEWGNLPPRIRDMLLQGRGESASALYRELTERYYRRLAEEASQPRD